MVSSLCQLKLNPLTEPSLWSRCPGNIGALLLYNNNNNNNSTNKHRSIGLLGHTSDLVHNDGVYEPILLAIIQAALGALGI